jgi:hypothetical protein
MNCRLYLRKAILYVPTMGKMDKGFYRGVEPVGVIPASNSEGVRECLRSAIALGNPAVSMLRRREIPPPVLLKYAGVNSWSAFERGLRLWNIVENDWSFRIAEQEKKQDGMWRDDPDHIVVFQQDASVEEVIDRMIAILQDAVRKPS